MNKNLIKNWKEAPRINVLNKNKRYKKMKCKKCLYNLRRRQIWTKNIQDNSKQSLNVNLWYLY